MRPAKKSCSGTPPAGTDSAPPIELKLKLFELLYRWGTLITIGLLIVFFGAARSSFLAPQNIINILRSISIVTVIAIGVSTSLSVGGLDLSVGSVASLADAVVISMFVWYGRGSAVAVPAAVLVCLLVGAFNAFLVVKIRVPDMLATLASLFIFQGVAMTYTYGGSITENMLMLDGSTAAGRLSGAFVAVGQVPTIILTMIVVVLIMQVFLTYTKHGRYMYVVGGNMEAARLSGISIGRYRTLAYLISSAFAALGGIMLASRIGSSQVNAGAAYLMDAVAAAYIGFSVGGSGKPNAVGTFVGAILIGILQNGLVMISVPYYAMDIIKGAVLVLALALTYVKKA
jgi:simple sugar transport system permease protein